MESHIQKFKNDRYKKNRGGYSRLLDISCEICKTHVCFYQKDGSGILKRMYLDRIFNFKNKSKNLQCIKCKNILGTYFIYQKEKRPAFRLYVAAVNKKITKL